MKRIVMLFVLFALTLVTSSEGSNKQSDLELFAFITTVEKDTYLNVRITNRGSQELTVPTGKPAVSSTTFPNILIQYDILTMGTKEDPERWKFIPSLVDLAPVTIRKGETATLTLKLTGDPWSDPDDHGKRIVNIDYVVTENIAKRFSLWHGSLKTKDSLTKLRNR
jgi:hypothetical protein